MFEMSQSILRGLSLTVMTALLAAVWQNDRPSGDTTVAVLPTDQQFFGSRQMLNHLDDHVVHMPLPGTTVDGSQTVSIGQHALLVRTISVEQSELHLTPAEFSRHLGKLPLTLPAADYRVIDSQGGTGWLHVSDAHSETSAAPSAELYTTEVDGQTLRFIPVDKAGIRTVHAE